MASLAELAALPAIRINLRTAFPGAAAAGLRRDEDENEDSDGSDGLCFAVAVGARRSLYMEEESSRVALLWAEEAVFVPTLPILRTEKRETVSPWGAVRGATGRCADENDSAPPPRDRGFSGGSASGAMSGGWARGVIGRVFGLLAVARRVCAGVEANGGRSRGARAGGSITIRPEAAVRVESLCCVLCCAAEENQPAELCAGRSNVVGEETEPPRVSDDEVKPPPSAAPPPGTLKDETEEASDEVDGCDR